MFKSLLLLPTLTAPSSAMISPIIQQANPINIAQGGGFLEVNFSKDDNLGLFADVNMGTFGAPDTKTAKSAKVKFLKWTDFAATGREFLDKYKMLKIGLHSKLGNAGVLNPKEENSIFDYTANLFHGYIEKTTSVSSDLQKSGGYKAFGKTVIETSTVGDYLYIQVSATVSSQWGSFSNPKVSAKIWIYDITFGPKLN